MRVLTAEELKFIAGGDDFDDVLAEIFVEVMAEIFVQVVFELLIVSTANAIHAVHDYFYPPQPVVTSTYFRPAALP
ncbi:hypothetical protein [Candidatus Berkiella aquae]|uniref:Uncharacterized protein n=1 Tax=Candidatus Berkiella aquae TaxID=295108 RepID=A0A0Q9YLY2_9GAMM|nr:hypothetical protein [Candidatus Berkiella aquae]MCS5710583.1 hypothetical protein [Candidatus Berkiella aquae]